MENNKVGSKKKAPWFLIILLIIVLLLVGAVAGLTYLDKIAAGNVLSTDLAEPLNGTASAEFTLDLGDGNLELEKNPTSEQLLVRGTLEYFENTGAPLSSVVTTNGHTEFTLTANGEQPWQQLPWSACNGATDWSIYLNPSVRYEITTLMDGGNASVDLTGLTVTSLNMETGGGNLEVTLPIDAENLDVIAKTGAGKVTVHVGGGIKGSNTIDASSGAGEVNVILPNGVATRIKVSTGTVSFGSEFIKINETTYETPGYQDAVDKVEITIGSGLGKANVIRN